MELIAKSMAVVEGQTDRVDITMTIHNAQRTFATTLSHIISMYVSSAQLACLLTYCLLNYCVACDDN